MFCGVASNRYERWAVAWPEHIRRTVIYISWTHLLIEECLILLVHCESLKESLHQIT